MRLLAAIWLTASLVGVWGPAGTQAAGPDTLPVAERNRDAIAVIIGNRRYSHGIPEVRYASNDAEAVSRFVTDVLGYRRGNVIRLDDASQAEMFAVFGNGRDHRGKLWSWIRPGRSDVLVYYSGHGMPGLRDRRGYLMPSDADPATPEINGYPLDLLLENLGKLDIRSTTVLLDACFSGNSAAGWLVPAASPVFVKAAPPVSSTGLTLITAAQGDQVASWDETARLGLFTRHLLDALRGAADRGRDGNGDGTVTLGEVERYLDDEMSYAARRAFQRVQRASVSGNPQTVLVAMLPPPAAVPPPAASLPPESLPLASLPPGAPVPVAGPYDPPGPDGASARAFLGRHRGPIERAIRAYYREQGSAWDHKPIAASLDFAERIMWFREVTLEAVRDDGMDLRASYAWEGNGRNGDAEALFRLVVAPDRLAVVKMWR